MARISAPADASVAVPDYAYILRPYATEVLICRPVQVGGEDMTFVIDPWTRKWSICDEITVEVLKLCDGKRRAVELARSIDSARREALVNVFSVLEKLMEAGLVFANKQEHRNAGVPVYNSCEPTGIHLEITNACNMTCTHCYVSSGRKLPNELTIEEIYKTIDMLPPFSGKRVAISGGEPAVRKDCGEIVEYCAVRCGHDVDLYTNGKNFPVSLLHRINEINEKKLGHVRIQLSLEGADASTNDAVRGVGSFDAAIASLRRFRQMHANRDVVIFVCARKQNIEQVDQLIQLAEEYDVGMLVFSQWQRQGNAIDTPWASIAPSLEEWVAAGEKILKYKGDRLQVYGNFFGDLNNSPAGRLSLESPDFPKHVYFYNAFPRIAPDGSVFADQLWVDSSWSLGNVRRQTLEDCFNSAKFHDQLQQMRERTTHIAECKACPWLHLCQGGSPGHTYAEYGDMNHKDAFCSARIFWFEQYVQKHATEAIA